VTTLHAGKIISHDPQSSSGTAASLTDENTKEILRVIRAINTVENNERRRRDKRQSANSPKKTIEQPV